MVRPSFVNNFVINKDELDEEILIHFKHGYSMAESIGGKKFNMTPENENIHSVVMTRKNAKRLRDLLNEVLEKEKK
jgi:hypothetical protein